MKGINLVNPDLVQYYQINSPMNLPGEELESLLPSEWRSTPDGALRNYNHNTPDGPVFVHGPSGEVLKVPLERLRQKDAIAQIWKEKAKEIGDRVERTWAIFEEILRLDDPLHPASPPSPKVLDPEPGHPVFNGDGTPPPFDASVPLSHSERVEASTAKSTRAQDHTLRPGATSPAVPSGGRPEGVPPVSAPAVPIPQPARQVFIELPAGCGSLQGAYHQIVVSTNRQSLLLVYDTQAVPALPLWVPPVPEDQGQPLPLALLVEGETADAPATLYKVYPTGEEYWLGSLRCFLLTIESSRTLPHEESERYYGKTRGNRPGMDATAGTNHRGQG